MRKIITVVLLLCSIAAYPQKTGPAKTEAWETLYRASATKINDLEDTKLDVNFDYSRSWMYGKAWLTLHPHFYPTDSLRLDAKGMTIKEVSMIKSARHVPLKYDYDSLSLRITLDRTYKGGENYRVFIQYIAKPDGIKVKGSKAISGNKGLYFINPSGKDKNKPTQIWTQGESESNSVWFPTIDKPNQKTTDEISMTVPGRYQTLSNGILVGRKKNSDGTRTDTWKMELPHAPYLMMMAVGEFAIIKDSYKGKEVSYYVEKEYAPLARKIFGHTPEMMAFFSRITGVSYPWPKYAQIVCRDYVSGAMENTTATLHAEAAQQDARQLVDKNEWEYVIAHELFHQWFGDYVTTESWSNLTLNESFADYSETLWEENKYGKDAGDEKNYNGMQNYLYSGSAGKDLVRFYYRENEDMFDAVSYQKGGRILSMLRNYVGDSAFFKSLNLYLRTREFQSAEAQDLRLAFEEVTGQDLNWFWNQWYYGSGHPKIDISYDYDAAGKTVKVFIKQNQPGRVFRFQTAMDVYQGGDMKRYKVWVEHTADTFAFPSAARPELVNIDGDKILLCEKTEHKTLDNYIFQYQHAGSYVDRREAIDYVAGILEKDPKASGLLITALKDRYYGLRIYALQTLKLGNDSLKNAVEPLLTDMAMNDPKTLVRAGAIEALGKFKKNTYKPLFLKSIHDSSYAIAGSALLALGAIDSATALNEAKILIPQHAKGALADAISNLLFLYADEHDFDSLSGRFDNLPMGYDKYMMLDPFSGFLKRVQNKVFFRKGIDMIVSFRDTIPEQYRQESLEFIDGHILGSIAAAKESTGMTDQAEYVKSKLPGSTKPQPPLEVPEEIAGKYTGEYDINGETIKVELDDDKILNLTLPDGSGWELSPLSKDKFTIKYRNGSLVEFTINEKNEITGMVLTSPDGMVKAPKKK